MKPVILILNSIRSTHNVGSILRSADCFGVKEIVFVGYTPYPEVPKDTRMPHLRKKITNAIHKTALGAEKTIKIIPVNSIDQAVAYVKNQGYLIAALEQAASSVSLQDFRPQKPVALILGNEVDGLPSQILGKCDIIIEIPLYGKKESLNVSIATAIALYALRNK